MKGKVASFVSAVFAAPLAACSPLAPPEARADRGPATSAVIAPASKPPAGWRRVNFVSGLSVAVPPTAKVAYPQGVDSSVMDVSGPDFTVTFDDYGPFVGNGPLRLAGRPADEATRTKGDCRHRVVNIELPEPWPLMSCPTGDTTCRVPNAKVAMNGLCRGPAGCGIVDAVIGSTRLTAGPHAPLPGPDPDWRPPEQPLYSVE